MQDTKLATQMQKCKNTDSDTGNGDSKTKKYLGVMAQEVWVGGMVYSTPEFTFSSYLPT